MACPLLDHDSPALESVRVLHPFRKRPAIAMPSAGAGSSPSGHSSEQRGSRRRESQGYGTAARSSDRSLGIGGGGVEPSLGVGRGKPGGRTHLLNEISPVLTAYAVMARGRQQNAAGLGALRTDIYIWRPSPGAKQPVEFVTEERFGSAGVRGRGAGRKRLRAEARITAANAAPRRTAKAQAATPCRPSRVSTSSVAGPPVGLRPAPM